MSRPGGEGRKSQLGRRVEDAQATATHGFRKGRDCCDLWLRPKATAGKENLKGALPHRHALLGPKALVVRANRP